MTGRFLAPEGIFAELAGVPFEGYEIHMAARRAPPPPWRSFPQ